jgi:hypothetical protein
MPLKRIRQHQEGQQQRKRKVRMLSRFWTIKVAFPKQIAVSLLLGKRRGRGLLLKNSLPFRNTRMSKKAVKWKPELKPPGTRWQCRGRK